MTLKSVLLYVMIAGAVLKAGVVVAPEISGPGTAFIPTLSLTQTGVGLAGGYIMNQATACFDANCSISVGSIVNTGPTVSDPLTLRITDATFTCSSAGAPCGTALVGWAFQFSLPTTTTFSV